MTRTRCWIEISEVICHHTKRAWNARSARTPLQVIFITKREWDWDRNLVAYLGQTYAMIEQNCVRMREFSWWRFGAEQRVDEYVCKIVGIYARISGVMAVTEAVTQWCMHKVAECSSVRCGSFTTLSKYIEMTLWMSVAFFEPLILYSCTLHVHCAHRAVQHEIFLQNHESSDYYYLLFVPPTAFRR